MSVVQRLLFSRRPAEAPTAPLLFPFVVPTLIVVVLVGLIAGGSSWLAVGGAIAAVIAMTSIVMLTLARLLADD